ncbi:MAG: hypothetical protein GFH27_549321n150 [Chloroflexi bacterium AL-W]|nr:hypothetical protein [Chloroflexi bacterium AL-N1]NOK65027.1 hypothetical protein [Chloroflexi bacterium AL-N10]NOK76797.1 hypothetical protein [Chloroflexi bacterium AL-N5]NOK84689.1 hypothetical protein [Chloroflexi bacterium AL-W]NOK86486.1 hypothetical protein [Chloroflexi bacterium AL-N15]
MTNQYSFGTWVKALRMAKEWTQRELAYQVNCSLSTIRKIEINERHPSHQLAQLLAAKLDVPSDKVPAFLEAAYCARQSPADAILLSTPPTVHLHDQHGFRPLTPLLGRTTELTAAINLIQRAEVSLLTIIGPGGVGKTRLAYALADQVYPVFAQGAQVVDLAAVASLEELLCVVITLLELPPLETRPLQEQILTGLQQQELLLVLDNFDHVPEAMSFVRQILSRAPHVTLLLTSRVPLQIDGEHEFRLAPLMVPEKTDRISLAQLSTNPAVMLLVTRAQALLPDFQLTTANARAIVTICRQVDGLPLGLELAATQLRVWSPADLAARLTHDLTMLTHTSRSASPRQHSLHATVLWSYRLLSPEVQHILRGMSILVGGATPDVIAAICLSAEVEHKTGVVAQGLNTLLDYSLVVAQDLPCDEHRFTLLETIRAVVREELHTTGDETLLRHQHAAYFADWAERHGDNLAAAQQLESLQQFDLELGNLRTALTWCYDHQQVLLLARLCIALWRYWYIRGLWDEGLTWHRRTLALPNELSLALQAALLSGASGFSLIYSDYTQATAWLDDAISHYRTVYDALGLARAFNRYGLVRWQQGQLIEARHLLEEGLSYCHQVDAPRDTANILANLGCVADEQGYHDQAMAFHQASLQIRRRLGDIHGIITDLLNLGKTALSQGDHHTAQQYLDEGLSCARELNYHQEEALFLINLGHNACYQRHLADAQAHLNEGLALTQRFGDRLNAAHALNNLGLIALFRYEIDVAMDLFNQSMHQFAAMDAWVHIPGALERLAYAYLERGHYQRSSMLLNSAYQMREQDGIKQTPVEMPLYEQAWEQLHTHGFIRNHLTEYEVGQVRAWLAGRVQERLDRFVG